MKIDAVIVEDESNNLYLLEKYLSEMPYQVNVLGTANGVDSAVRILNTVDADIVFMDVQIKGGTGFDVLEAVEKKNLTVIFTTAYAEYAINAIKKRAFDYLLKPLKKNELIEALNQFVENRKASSQADGQKEGAYHFSFQQSSGGYETVPLADIIYFKASGAYTEVVLKSRTFLVSRNVGDIEETLVSGSFFRVHHSFIVNVNHIIRMEMKRSGVLEMTNADEIPVSQRKKRSSWII